MDFMDMFVNPLVMKCLVQEVVPRVLNDGTAKYAKGKVIPVREITLVLMHSVEAIFGSLNPRWSHKREICVEYLHNDLHIASQQLSKFPTWNDFHHTTTLTSPISKMRQ